MIDHEGIVAVHTGSQTIPESGHIVGDGFSCQANMMWNDSVWEACTIIFQSLRAISLEGYFLHLYRSIKGR